MNCKAAYLIFLELLVQMTRAEEAVRMFKHEEDMLWASFHLGALADAAETADVHSTGKMCLHTFMLAADHDDTGIRGAHTLYQPAYAGSARQMPHLRQACQHCNGQGA